MQKTTPSTTEHDANQLPTATAVTDAVEETVETSQPVGVVHAPSPAPMTPVKYQPATRRELRALEAAAAITATSARKAPAARTATAPATVLSAPAVAVLPAPAAVRTASARYARISSAQSALARTAAARPIGPNSRAAGTRAGTKTADARMAAAPASGMRRRIISKLVTVGAMAGVGLIFISTTVPANAFVRVSETQSSISNVLSNGESTQTLAVVIAPGAAVPRDAYTVVSAKQKASAVSRDKVYSYVGNPTGAIQWPFPEGSPISSGFGPRRVANCSACSTFHEGLDFTPGSGTPIHAVADGIVSLVDLGGALGNHVAIDHVINGQVVQSVYAHMQYGSITVAMGQRVTVGQVIGEVGSTGISTGSHLHLEIHLGGVPVDPYIWLTANAK